MSIFGSITEEVPKYKLLQKFKLFETRLYEKQLRAQYSHVSESLVAGSSQLFRPIAGYIFGANKSGNGTESIAMTAPVILENTVIEKTATVLLKSESQHSIMSFVLPSKYQSLDQLPTPINENVKLVQIDPYKVAVLQFSGRVNDNIAKEKENELRSLCSQEGIKVKSGPGSVQLAQYNPPWTLPFLRTNEIHVSLQD